MRPGRIGGAAALLIALVASPARSFAADIVVTGPDGVAHQLSPETMSAMAKTEIVFDNPGRGQSHRFEGPLLWTVLSQAGAIDPAQFHGQVRQYVLLTGQDGYTALIALGEIAPEFEGKPVIVAESMDGTPLGADHLRIVVPNDKRGGRGVHNLVRIGVTTLPR